MTLRSLLLKNFRTYSELKFDFSSLVTVLVGDNAQGKSNFLESVYFLATSKSPKLARDEELVRNESASTLVRGSLGDETELEISMALIEGGLHKRLRVNGVARRAVDYIGNFSVVLFSPEDINLVTDSPGLRRWHLDLLLAQIDRQYKSAITLYERIVSSKNRVLKQIQEGWADLRELEYWVSEQARLGQLISQKRRQFFEFINQQAPSLGSFQYLYKESSVSQERLKEYERREIASASSLIGPHRDDFEFLVKEGGSLRDLSKFGSRGEQRTAVLDLKLLETDFIEHVSSKRPILLLDDVFSELDESHREHVLTLVKRQQTVIATIELDRHLQEFFLKQGQILVVKRGELKDSYLALV